MAKGTRHSLPTLHHPHPWFLEALDPSIGSWPGGTGTIKSVASNCDLPGQPERRSVCIQLGFLLLLKVPQWRFSEVWVKCCYPRRVKWVMNILLILSGQIIKGDWKSWSSHVSKLFWVHCLWLLRITIYSSLFQWKDMGMNVFPEIKRWESKT